MDRINENYLITDSISVGGVEYVLGVHTNHQNMYVTWECIDGDDYRWGHYHNSEVKAKADLLNRALHAVEYWTYLATHKEVYINYSEIEKLITDDKPEEV